MAEKIEAKVTHHFAAGPEQVYEALTDPGSVRLWHRAWLAETGLSIEGATCRIDPAVGGQFLFADIRDGREARHWGTFLALERPRRISYSWIVDESEADDPSIVTIIIEPAPDGAGATATLYHEMDAKWSGHRARTETGWMAMLGAADAVLQGNGPAA